MVVLLWLAVAEVILRFIKFDWASFLNYSQIDSFILRFSKIFFQRMRQFRLGFFAFTFSWLLSLLVAETSFCFAEAMPEFVERAKFVTLFDVGLQVSKGFNS